MRKLLILLVGFMPFGTAQGAIRIIDPVFREFEDGPPITKNAKHLPEDTVFLTFQIADFKVEGEDRKVHLSYRIEARDPDRLLIAEPRQGEVKVELSHEDKDWRPKVRVEAPVPASAPGGTYHLLLSVFDEEARVDTKADIPFEVSGPALNPVPKITAEAIQFQRTEEDTTPLSPPVYHPGDTLWVRFTFRGYRFGPKNKFHIQYGLALKNADGKVLFSQPTAADLEEEGYYPRRYVPATFNLKLDKTIAPGEYTVLLIVRDLVASETTEYPETFRVE